MVCPAATRVGVLPPIVTVTESIECLPLVATMTNSPQRASCGAGDRCCMGHSGTLACTVPVIVVSVQVTPWRGMPPTVTLGQAALALPLLQPPAGAGPKP